MKKYITLIVLVLLVGCSTGKKVAKDEVKATQEIVSTLEEAKDIKVEEQKDVEVVKATDEGETTKVIETVEEFSPSGTLTKRTTSIIDKSKTSALQSKATDKTKTNITDKTKSEETTTTDTKLETEQVVEKGMSAWQRVRIDLFNWLIVLGSILLIIKYRKNIWQFILRLVK